MSSFIQDLRHALRQLWRRPIFTLTAVLTLAIGIGVNAVAFTVVNGLLFQSWASATESDVGRIATIPGGDEGGHASVEEYRRFADATRGALEVAAEGRLSVAWRHDNTTETAWVLFVSPNYFGMVNAKPLAGRLDVAPGAGRPGAGGPGAGGPGAGGPASVVIGERFWRRKLNAASPAGLTLRLNNLDVAVAGVVPESFTGPSGLYSPDVWLPLDGLADFNTAPALLKRDTRWLFLMGRVKPGMTVPQIQGHVDAAAAAMARDWPDTHRQRGARFFFRERNGELRGVQIAASIVMGIIGLVLLLACFNVANLLLARAVERERDMGIRAALGAGTGRLVRLVLMEGVAIAGLAGVIACLLARWTQAFVGTFAIPIEEPQHVNLSPDTTVLGFIAVLVIVAGVLPGLWPALAAARVDVLRVLGSLGAGAESGKPSRMRRGLVGAQIVGSTVFLAIAALAAQSYGRVSVSDFGFDHDQLVAAEFDPASHGFDADRAERYARALLTRVRSLPGVTDAALADHVPFFIGMDRQTPVSTTGAPCEAGGCPTFSTMAVGPGYFRTMGIPLVAGHEFEDGGSVTNVIINQPLAQLQWPDGQGLGRTLRIVPSTELGAGDRTRAITVTVIGITAKTYTRGLIQERPTLYLPVGRREFEGGLSLVARGAVPPETLVRPFHDAALAVDPDVSMLSLKTMRQRMAVQLWPFRTVTWLFSICGGLALVLATTGVAGVVIHAVNRRMREFGVRVSVGATPRDLVREVMRSSAGLLLPGLVVGIVLAAVIARLLQAAFLSVNVLNPLTYLAVALLECAIVIAASVGPALRAARVDPLVALRSE
jgi:predicted permease